ncbi:hypothetical protein HO173_011604 [Letharia columbiana]|uniref:Uncharacterized protein n=1 Tax=Letharia columbiana TaxID=112416 RepID=A0A8H6FHH2_9LECA|nr:uncharacterized protein HO173_011604 [Letharia columbiana]KAF6228757.1 hypothetical protein HO173_011604 [Letharia columbiana]
MAEFVEMQSNEDVVVDIIFVENPIEQNLRDWEESFGHLEWFKEAFPRHSIKTRSLYYRYHGQSSRDSPVEVVNHAAHGLLSEWAKLETHSLVKPLIDSSGNAVDEGDGLPRPVLFVCQGLGGLVVEEV